MVAQGKGMAGTVVWGARVWTGSSHLANSRDRSPKNEVFSFWSPYTLTPTPELQAVPSYAGIWMGERELIFCLDQLVFCPPPALLNEVPNGLFG